MTHSCSFDWLIAVSLSGVSLRGLQTCIEFKLSGNAFRKIIQKLSALKREFHTASKAGQMFVSLQIFIFFFNLFVSLCMWGQKAGKYVNEMRVIRITTNGKTG